jgi:hypothetical protein
MKNEYGEFRSNWKVLLAAAVGAGAGVTGAMVSR